MYVYMTRNYFLINRNNNKLRKQNRKATPQANTSVLFSNLASKLFLFQYYLKVQVIQIDRNCEKCNNLRKVQLKYKPLVIVH